MTLQYIPNERALAHREKEQADSQLRDHLTYQRRDQIKNVFNSDPRLFEAEKKYGKYLLVPLALPIFEVPDSDHFMYWWKKYAIRPVKQHGDYVASGTGYSPFESIDLVQKVGNDWNLNLQTDNFKQEFPYLWQQFYDQLPCDDLLVINLWSSVRPFTEHRDSAEMIDAPNSFRIKLYDENPEETLFVFDNPITPYRCEEPVFFPRIPTTNSYMWNNLRVKHGSVYVPGYKKVLAAIVGLVNPDRYESLMKKSIETYSEYCVQSNYNIENYVDV
jgi:hypothetical protein